jgi:hypothetical protein
MIRSPFGQGTQSGSRVLSAMRNHATMFWCVHVCVPVSFHGFKGKLHITTTYPSVNSF